MTPFYEARELILKSVSPSTLVKRLVPDRALGLFLADAVHSIADMPPFDNSAMDGYAVRAADVENQLTLPLSGTAAAGARPPALEPGKAMRILTGAPVPAGADAVIMQEEATVLKSAPPSVRFLKVPRIGQNIREAGREFKAGEMVLNRFTQITPAGAALTHAAGLPKCTVIAPPKCVVFVTGDELVSPGSKLRGGQIFDSNGTGIASALRAMHIDKIAVRHVKDRAASVRSSLARGLSKFDVVIVSGGVSVGDRDFVRQSLEALGVVEKVWGVAIKPGKPFYFGVGPRGQYVFGLPGNPVSVLVTFHELVRPALRKWMGAVEPMGPSIRARLTAPVQKKPGRLEFLRGRLQHRGGDVWIEPVGQRESHMLGSLALADALIVFPQEMEKLEEGSEIEVHPLQWFS